MKRRRKPKLRPSENPMVRQIVGNIYVGASDAEVEKVVRSKIKKAYRFSPDADAIVADAIKHHHYNQEVYRSVMGGIY